MPGQLLNLFIRFAVFSDSSPTLHPRLQDEDWDRQFEGITTGNSFSRRVDVPPAQSISVATTARSLSQDATTQYTVTRPDPDQNTFRFRWTGGTNPVLKTARTPGHDATTQFTVTKTGSVIRFTATGGTIPNFSTAGVIVGDQLNIESTTPTVTSPFNTLNQGVFTVVAVSTTFVEVLSIDGNGVAEGPITLGSRSDSLPALAVYSSAGVQVKDEALIQAVPFHIVNRGAFQVSKVTSTYFDVTNGTPGLAEGPITIGAIDGIVFYPSIWKWLYIETDQKVSVRINGDTSDRIQIEPVVAGSRDKVGVYLQRGQVYSVSLANNGLVTADCKATLAE